MNEGDDDDGVVKVLRGDMGDYCFLRRIGVGFSCI